MHHTALFVAARLLRVSDSVSDAFTCAPTCTLTSHGGMLLCLLALDYTMMYLMRGSMREGKVAPGLWGPWTITDFSGWSDQMTLDYNFECVVCHRQSLSIRRPDNHTL